MIKRAWVTAKVSVDLEWDDKNEFGYVDALKEKLAEAGIADFHGTEYDKNTVEWQCENCGKFKEGKEYCDSEDGKECNDCLVERSEETDDRDDLRNGGEGR